MHLPLRRSPPLPPTHPLPYCPCFPPRPVPAEQCSPQGGARGLPPGDAEPAHSPPQASTPTEAASPTTAPPPPSDPPPPPQEKSYAFVEMRSVEEASNAMALDGVRFRDSFLKVRRRAAGWLALTNSRVLSKRAIETAGREGVPGVPTCRRPGRHCRIEPPPARPRARAQIRRPNNYDPAAAVMLGPTDPSPGLDLSGIEAVRTVVHDSPQKLFLGGLPCDWAEEQASSPSPLLGVHAWRKQRAIAWVGGRGCGAARAAACASCCCA